MATSETKIETIVLAIIDAVLPTVETRGMDEDASTVTVPNRITVDVQPKTGMLSARSATRKPKVLQANVSVRAQSNTTATGFDAWKESIDGALFPSTDTYPTAIVTLSASLFPNGIEFIPLESGDQVNGDQRVFTRSFRAMFIE